MNTATDASADGSWSKELLGVDAQIGLRKPHGGDRATPYDLDELVAEITDENHHELISFGKSVGREVW